MMQITVTIREPLVQEIREAAQACGVLPGNYCEHIIEQWCAERRLLKLQAGTPLPQKPPKAGRLVRA